MAAHHHPQPYTHHHCYHLNSYPAATAAYCCCCFPPPPDPLVHSHLLHPLPAQPHLYSSYLNQSYNPHNLHDHQTPNYPPQIHKQNQQFRRHHHQEEEHTVTRPMVSSLLRRIATLESSLRHHSSPSYSLRDDAARAIQTHFRAFLVRRSRTLRHLKDLAFIKSTLNTLKSSLSDNTHFDSQALSHKAMDLLIKLDSIRDGDPMIRDGKRSISRELIRFMEFIDEVSVKRHELSSRALKNVRFGGNSTKSRVLHCDRKVRTVGCGGGERELREQVEKKHGFSRVSEEEEEEEEEEEKDVELENPRISINGKCCVSQNRMGSLVKGQSGVQPKVKKNVSFAENGKVYRVSGSSHRPISSGDCNGINGIDSIDGERHILDKLFRDVEEIRVSSKETEDDEEADTEDEEGSPAQISDDERDPRRNMRTEDNCERRKLYQIEGEDGSFVFSAPMPVKMESRADFVNKKKNVKLVQ